MHTINMCAVSVVLLLGSLSCTTALYYPQYFQGFSYEYCIGTPIDFLETNTNVSQQYPDFIVKTTTLKGLWRVTRSTGGLTVTTVTRSLNGDNRLCSMGKFGEDFPPVNSTEKLASGDLDDSVLTLFEADFKGEPIVVGEDGVSKIDPPFTVVSWALTGVQGFTVFDGEDFTGNATCLEAELTAKNAGYGISVEFIVAPRLVVKSVKFGCDGNVKNIRTGNSEIKSLSWDNSGKIIEGFEVVEPISKVIVL